VTRRAVSWSGAVASRSATPLWISPARVLNQSAVAVSLCRRTAKVEQLDIGHRVNYTISKYQH